LGATSAELWQQFELTKEALRPAAGTSTKIQ